MASCQLETWEQVITIENIVCQIAAILSRPQCLYMLIKEVSKKRSAYSQSPQDERATYSSDDKCIYFDQQSSK